MMMTLNCDKSEFMFIADEEIVDSGEESSVEANECSSCPDEVPYPSARMVRSSDVLSNLPSTVEVLNTHDGCRVFLVGTAHFSESSQQDVAKVCISVEILIYATINIFCHLKLDKNFKTVPLLGYFLHIISFITSNLLVSEHSALSNPYCQ